VRVLVSDDYPMFAAGLAEVLREREDIWVAVAAEAPRQLVFPLSADVLIVGLDADVKGIWATCDHLVEIGGAKPPPIVLILPGRSEFEMTAAASVGAAAVLPRTATGAAVAEALAAVLEGRTLVAAGMGERMLADFAGMLRRRREATGLDVSTREQQVLELIAEGRSNRDIAGALHISEATVKNHVRRILEKLGAGSRTEALVIAARAGLVVVGQGSSSPSPRRA
jgi:DNA-binding NarL/FixJ family response regulator